MKVAVIANDELREEFLSKETVHSANVCFVNSVQDVPADSYIVFDLLFEYSTERVALLKHFLPRPVFINAVTDTLAVIAEPFIRINAWPTFLGRTVTEIAVLTAQEKILPDVFEKLGWKYQLVPDCIGMVSARITGAIINEAYHTLQEGVSTKSEIDTAMKLGTNYPYGPFEWSEKIGLKKIQTMLSRLSEENDLYEVSTLLTNEIIL
ncbi:MAG: 3-hydroxyacyl-CoA dehydrogenase family protein [Chitinophagaceae bacterium]